MPRARELHRRRELRVAHWGETVTTKDEEPRLSIARALLACSCGHEIETHRCLFDAYDPYGEDEKWLHCVHGCACDQNRMTAGECIAGIRSIGDAFVQASRWHRAKASEDEFDAVFIMCVADMVRAACGEDDDHKVSASWVRSVAITLREAWDKKNMRYSHRHRRSPP
jgi:hypothetical protein